MCCRSNICSHYRLIKTPKEYTGDGMGIGIQYLLDFGTQMLRKCTITVATNQSHWQAGVA